MYASAFIVGPDDGPGLALEHLSMEMNFKTIAWYTDLADAEEQTKSTPICFFLFSSALDMDIISDIARAIRFSRNRQVRFAPLVSFCEAPSRQAIEHCLQAGFDDIITPPFTSARVLPRLELLVGRKQVFYETSTYFGPDRRGRSDKTDKYHVDRGVGGEHRRLEIVRDTNIGVKVLRDQQFKGLRRRSSERGLGSIA